jgi:hypothetical protein
VRINLACSLARVTCAAALLAAGDVRQSPVPPVSAQEPRVEQKRPVKRVRVDLSGFELAQAPPPKSSTQLGGGARMIGGETTLLAPVKGRSFTATPMFAWTHGSQVRKFEFRLFDETGALIQRMHVTGRQVSYPPDAPELLPGTTYLWSVQPEAAMFGGPSRKSAIVRLDAAEIEEISRQLAQPGVNVDPAEWNAQVFTDRRLWYDAVAAWSELIERFPSRADLREKRGQIYDQLPATQALAEEDFAAADRLRTGQQF